MPKGKAFRLFACKDVTCMEENLWMIYFFLNKKT